MLLATNPRYAARVFKKQFGEMATGLAHNPSWLRERVQVMESKTEIYKTAALEDSTWAVVRTETGNPRLLEVIATFYDEARARDYAAFQNGETGQPEARQEEAPLAAAPVSREAPSRQAPRKNGSDGDLSQRQSAVLNALRDMMDQDKQVAARAAVLAKAAQIPLGSLHSVLGSLEKKNLIQSTRPGSARSPAVYRVL